ncbi:MAG: hypothetical protein M3237_03770 [Actinomycetota bacterium]|nr:hypothetical protein [Actinomycetota bacterium]
MRVTLSIALTFGLLVGCSGDDEPPRDPDRVVLAPADPGSEHTHATGEAGATAGDGTVASAGGYTLTDLRLPQRAGEPGDLSFRIVDPAGKPLLSYAEEQTKLLHLYVVRNDLQEFRHLHPTLADDGTWTARVNLAAPGSYRVLTEFTPGEDPDGRHVVLGRIDIVAGTWSPEQVTAATEGDDGLVRVTAPETVPSGPDQRMTLTVEDADGGSPQLGTYLGTFAHLTGFDVETGAFTHAHPYGEPEVGEDGTELSFHTELDAPGRYVFFVQVRVDGFVHTVPVATTVT